MAGWNPLAKAPHNVSGGSLVAARKQNPELIAAEPRDEVNLSQGYAPPKGALAEEFVPGCVAGSVIDGLQPVEVEYGHGHGFARAGGPGELLGERASQARRLGRPVSVSS